MGKDAPGSREGTPLTQTEIKDLGNQIASAASTTLSTKKPIVSVSIFFRDRPIRAQVIQPPPVEGGRPFAVVNAMWLKMREDQRLAEEHED